jgi:acylphosphatase
MRIEIVFHGRVQGVAFRFTTRAIALEEGVRGWVRNEPDGTVRMVADGDDGQVSAFLSRLRDRMAGFITNEDTHQPAAGEELDGFQIRR